MRLLLPILLLTAALSLHTRKPQARRLKSLSQRRSAQLTAKIVQSAMKQCLVGTKTTSPSLFFVRCAVTAFTRSASNNVRLRVPWHLFSILIVDQGAKKRPVTCVYCRSPWLSPETEAASAGSGSTMREGYLNMSGAAGISGIRDTSSCES